MEPLIRSTLPLHRDFTQDYLEYYKVLPIEVVDDKLVVAVAGSPAPEVMRDLQDSYGVPLETWTTEPEALEAGLEMSFADAESMTDLVESLSTELGEVVDLDELVDHDIRDLANQPPVIRFVNLLIKEAHQARASDIHLDASATGLIVRFRIDGALTGAPAPPVQLQAAVVSRIKLIAELDIAERMLPQDGRVRVRLEETELDLRVSTIPSLYGESVVIRLLDQAGGPVDLTDLGMPARVLEDFKRLARKPHGIVLSTGPTGSGKTTTLYSGLQLRDLAAEKVITLEDPVEYQLHGVTQVPVNRRAGMTFAKGLRSILRQDPDVVMVGEMRDPETAEIAVQAALTGHLVFSTLHTNDAVGAVSRLVDLGVEPYLLAATLAGVLAQRLVRRICSDCAEPYDPDPAMLLRLEQFGTGPVAMRRGAGCSRCRGTGFRGRIGLFELLVLDEPMQRHLLDPSSSGALRRAAADAAHTSLRSDGWSKVRAGLTTPEEVIRVVQA